MKTRVCAVALLCCLTACKSYTPLSKPLRDEFAGDLTNLQLYISDAVELSRELRSEERGVSKHVIRIEKGKQIEIVAFGRNTPGVLARVGSDKDELHVRFEDDPKGDRALVFRLEDAPEVGGVYLLQTNGTDDTVVYDGKNYAASARPHLRIDLQEVEQVETDARVVPGVRLEKK